MTLEQNLCDWCGRETGYNPEVPKIIVIKRIARNDLNYETWSANMDLCDVCSLYLTRLLEKKTKLRYKSLSGNRNNYVNRILADIESQEMGLNKSLGYR